MENITFNKLVSLTRCPDEIQPGIVDKVEYIRVEYERKFMEIVRCFWTQVNEQTTDEEKRIILDSLHENIKIRFSI